MTLLSTGHLLKGDELNSADIHQILTLAAAMKKDKNLHQDVFKNHLIALIFDKPSLRTRFSFTAAAARLGAQTVESLLQTRKAEDPQDVIRVIQSYCQAAVIRTFDDQALQTMQAHAEIPIINALTDLYHPCQSLADLLTLQEKFGTLEGLKIAYIGDGNNILHSLMLIAAKIGVKVHYCCPKGHQPVAEILAKIKNKALLQAFSEPQEAVKDCQAVYTDVWTSMGFEQKDESVFAGFQVNEKLMSYAAPEAIFMHCMPMERGKEVSQTLPDKPCSVIFSQSANRLYAQEALLFLLMSSR